MLPAPQTELFASYCSSRPHCQKYLIPCGAQSSLLSAFRHNGKPLVPVPCRYYKHEFKPMARYGTQNKVSLVHRGNRRSLLLPPSTGWTRSAKRILESEIVPSRIISIISFSFMHIVCFFRKQILSPILTAFNSFHLLTVDWEQRFS